MFLEVLKKYKTSIIFRLTFLYTSLFILVFLITFFLLYEMISIYLETSKDKWLLEEIEELQSVFQKSSTSLDETKKKIDEEILLNNKDIFYSVRDLKGNILLNSNQKEWLWMLERNNFFPWNHKYTILWETIRYPTKKFSRTCYIKIFDTYILQVAIYLKEEKIFLKNLIKVFIPVFVFSALISLNMIFFMVKNTLRPVHEMTKAAREISFKNIEQRIPSTGVENELEELAVTINNMLDRIQSLINNVKETNDHLAHNLRTPIGRIRLNAEIQLLGENQCCKECEVLGNCLIECDRMLEMLNTMLDISEVEAGILSVYRKRCDLNDLILKNLEIFQDIAEYKGIVLEYKEAKEIFVKANKKVISQAIGNLIDNAIKYTASGGKIDIHLYTEDNQAILEIIDTGIGISEKDLQHIFDRFYRAENALYTSGSGLGLSFVKAAIYTHQGKIEVKSQIDQGTVFRIFLPMS